MKITDVGGEFALIDQLCSLVPTEHRDLIVSVGDDAAVIRTAPEPAPYLLVTTDILVEDRHFRKQWSGPHQIGIKAAECNISDIAAMGGRPSWMFVSVVLTRDTDLAWSRDLYAGIAEACRRYGVVVAGGDTTQGAVNTINITLLGSVSPENLCLRSQAAPDDLLLVTGPLGAPAAALALLEQGMTPSAYLLEKHLTPISRMDISSAIAPLANAMIDISDGLGSEVHHICRKSRVGAEIYTRDLPIHDDVLEAAGKLGVNPAPWALSGGEDFELLFSMPADKLAALEKTGVVVHTVGKITDIDGNAVLIATDGRRMPLPGGYNHFA